MATQGQSDGAGAGAGGPNIVFFLIDDMGWRDVHAALIAWRAKVEARIPQVNPAWTGN